MRRRLLPVLLVVPVAALAACSGSASGSSPAPASLTAEATGPYKAGAECDRAGFTSHAALAAGAVGTYVWAPFTKGSFKADAKDRAAAVKDAAGASALAAREMKAAAPLVEGCPGSVTLVNALAAGTSLADAAHGQLVKGTVNAQTLAGVNSVIGTVTAQSVRIGVTLTPAAATRDQVLAAS